MRSRVLYFFFICKYLRDWYTKMTIMDIDQAMLLFKLYQRLQRLTKRYWDLKINLIFIYTKYYIWVTNGLLHKEYEALQRSKHNLWKECETHKRSSRTLNDKLLKDDSLKGQLHDVIKLHEETDTLKKSLAKYFGGSNNLDKLLMYNKSPMDKSSHG